MGSGVLNAGLRANLRQKKMYEVRTPLLTAARNYDVIVIDELYFYYARGGGTKAAGQYQWELQLLCRVLLQANPALHILVCLEPSEGLLKLEQRCPGGSLARRMEDKARYYNRRPAGVVSASVCSSSSSSTAGAEAELVSGSYASVSFGLYERGSEWRNPEMLQQAAHVIVRHRSVPVLRRFVAGAKLTQELEAFQDDCSGQVHFMCCPVECDSCGPAAGAAVARLLHKDRVAIICNDTDHLLQPHRMDTFSLVDSTKALNSPASAEVLVNYTARAQDALLQLFMPYGTPVPPMLLAFAAITALAALQEDTGFRRSQNKGIGPVNVYKAVRGAVCRMDSRMYAYQTLKQFVVDCCHQLDPENEDALIPGLAQAVLSIAGQYVVVPLRRDFSKATLTHQQFFGPAELDGLRSLLPLGSIHRQLWLPLSGILQQFEVAADALAAACRAAGSTVPDTELQPAALAGMAIARGHAVLMPGALIGTSQYVQGLPSSKGVQSIASTFRQLEKAAAAEAAAAEPQSSQHASGSTSAQQHRSVTAAAAEAAAGVGNGVCIPLTRHHNRLLISTGAAGGAPAAVLGLAEHHQVLMLYTTDEKPLVELPASQQYVGVRSIHSHWVIELWEPVRRALLLSLPDPLDAGAAVAVLEPYTPAVQNDSSCYATLQLTVGGSVIPYDRAVVRSAAKLFAAEQKYVQSRSTTSVAANPPQPYTIVMPLAWQANPGVWSFTPSEYQSLGLAGCDVAALMQPSDGQMAAIGIVTPFGITGLALFGYHATGACEGASTVQVQLLTETVANPAIEMSLLQSSCMLDGARVSCVGPVRSSSSTSSSSVRTRMLSALQQLQCIALKQMSDKQRYGFDFSPMLQLWDRVAAMLRKPSHELRVRYLLFEAMPTLHAGLVAPLECSILEAEDFGLNRSLHPVPGCSPFAPQTLQMQASLTGSVSAGAGGLSVPAGFAHGSGISRLLDTRQPVVVALYLQGTTADSVPFAVVPATAPCLDSVVGSITANRFSATKIYLTQFRRAFDLLLTAGFAAVFPDDQKLSIQATNIHKTTGTWIGSFVPPLALLPPTSVRGKNRGKNSKSPHVAAMEDVLQSQQTSKLLLQLEAVPLTSPLQRVSQQLLPSDLGLDGYAAAINRQPSDVRVVPLLTTVMLKKTADVDWVMVDVMEQLRRCWRV